MVQSIIGLNIKRIRKLKGLSQAQVADLSGISRVAYGEIERGNSNPRVSTLQSIAAALEVKLEDILIQPRILKRVRFRSLKKMKSRDYILGEVARWLDDYNYLENLLGYGIEYRFKDFSSRISDTPPGMERAKKAAMLAREYLNLGEREPIRDIAGLLESSGIKLHTINLASEDFFGFSLFTARVIASSVALRILFSSI
jgi:transcriptional regulator with XRE-family HTH domain